ncbi:sigma-70 family RNA polymerase sigma factor [Actinomadura miaoliensis]|uniref:sigma-70 family RNA polymerase sigma factor n=1 Tax=Actinomadura miaoliensis TaxID=430685 RepID=UPI0031E85C3F
MSRVARAYKNHPRYEPSGPDEERDLLGQYLSQIGATALLTAEQEVELSKRIEAGLYARHLLDAGESGRTPRTADATREELEALARDGRLAKDHMIRANLRLVVSAAKKYAGRGLPMLDVIQEGNLGLIHAVEKFDYAKGYKFSTYSMWWIRQAIGRGLADKARTVRLPAHVLEELTRLARIERRLETAGHEPTAEEVAAAAGQPVDRVVDLRRAARETLSLDTMVGEDGETRVGDLIADATTVPASEVLEFENLAQELRALVDELPPREALILTLRYGLHDGRPHTLQDIADRIGLTRERVRQLEKGALARLRDPSRRDPLLAWVS